MRYLKLFLIFILVLVQFSFVLSQEKENCKELLLDYYKNLDASIKKSQNKAFYTIMTYKSWMNSKSPYPMANVPVTESRVEWVSYKQRSVYKNESLEVYMDERDMFTVINKDKIVVWQEISNVPNKTSNNIQGLFRDSLFISSQLLSCKNAPISFGLDVLKMNFLLSAKYKRLTKAKSCNVYFDKVNKKIVALEVFYLPDYKIRRQLIKYEKQHLVDNSILKKPVKMIVLNSKEHLSNRYKNYILKDYRNKK